MGVRYTRLDTDWLSVTLTGANDCVDIYHGLCEGGIKAVPDRIDVRYSTSQESGGGGGVAAVATYNCESGGGLLPVAADSIRITNSLGIQETWAWAAARVLPFQMAIGTTKLACNTNAVAAINADTRQNIVADINAALVRVQSAAYPGGPVEFGIRNMALTSPVAGTAIGWNIVNMNLSAGGGAVSGSPAYSILAQTANYVRLRFRGLQANDSLTAMIRCHRDHSLGRAMVPTKVSGVNNMQTTLGSRIVTSAGGGFLTALVRPGDFLTIHDLTDRACNGIYLIDTIDSATQLTLAVDDCPIGLPKTIGGGGVTYTIGAATVLNAQDPGGAQVPFPLPSTDSHSTTTPAVDVELPGQAITTPEIADLGITEIKLANAVKQIRADLETSAPALPTPLVGRGMILGTGNEGLVDAPGAMLVRVTTGGAAYDHRGRQATIGTSNAIVIGVAPAVNHRNDIVVWNQATAAFAVRAGAEAIPPAQAADPVLTAGDIPLARVHVTPGLAAVTATEIQDIRCRGFIEASACSFQPVMDAGEHASVIVAFHTGNFADGATIQIIAAGETWTGQNAGPAAREFLCENGFAADCAAFIAAVNADVSSAVFAYAGPSDTAVLVAKSSATVLTPVSGDANATVICSNARVAAADKTMAEGNYVVNANGALDVARLAAGDEIVIGAFFVPTGGTPRIKSFFLQTVGLAIKLANTLVVQPRLLAAVAGGNYYSVSVADAGAVLAVSEIIEWTCIW
ncbi:MAG: hypothetical protein V2A76_16210 [Planctomycetota bacterium]